MDNPIQNASLNFATRAALIGKNSPHRNQGSVKHGPQDAGDARCLQLGSMALRRMTRWFFAFASVAGLAARNDRHLIRSSPFLLLHSEKCLRQSRQMAG